MNKLIPIIGLILLTACISPNETPASTPIPAATSTRIILTPVRATVTSTDTPTPTATDIPPKRYFTDEFEAAPKYWSVLYASGEPGRVEILYEDSLLTFELHNLHTWLYVVYGAFEYEGVHIETRITSHGSDINAMGLVCNYDEQDGWYEFNISSDGSYNLLYGQWLAQGIARYTPILNDTTDLIETGQSTNEIGLDCYENIVQLYLNGNLFRKLDLAHIGLTGGKVGLSLASFEEAPVILSFDWVRVSRP